jgi:hypothetical protein
MVDALNGKLVRKNNHLDNSDGFRDMIQSPRQIVNSTRLGWPVLGLQLLHQQLRAFCNAMSIRPFDYSLQSLGIADMVSGKVTVGEFVDCSVKSIKEKAGTLCSWIQRKARGLWDGIE